MVHKPKILFKLHMCLISWTPVSVCAVNRSSSSRPSCPVCLSLPQNALLLSPYKAFPLDRQIFFKLCVILHSWRWRLGGDTVNSSQWFTGNT